VKFSRLLVPFFLCSLLTAAALAAEDAKKPTPTPAATPAAQKKEATAKNMHKKHGPGLLDDLWAKIKPTKKAAAPGTAAAVLSDAVERPVGNHKLMIAMKVEPQPLKLSDARQMKVTVVVANKSSKLVQLEFPTTQRIEVLVRNASGKLVEQWSEDRTFANEPGIRAINPGERLEYAATLSTRDLVVGQSYTVEALFPNYESLRLQKTVVPEK
jgi:hypothetical protein